MPYTLEECLASIVQAEAEQSCLILSADENQPVLVACEIEDKGFAEKLGGNTFIFTMNERIAKALGFMETAVPDGINAVELNMPESFETYVAQTRIADFPKEPIGRDKLRLFVPLGRKADVDLDAAPLDSTVLRVAQDSVSFVFGGGATVRVPRENLTYAVWRALDMSGGEVAKTKKKLLGESVAERNRKKQRPRL